jgi:ferredoxin
MTLNAKFAEIWPHISEKGEAPQDADTWSGRPDKLSLLSENPGQAS